MFQTLFRDVPIVAVW